MLIEGTNTSNTLTGTLGDDVINAYGGNDTINATQGADLIDGGAGTDRLSIIMGDVTRFASLGEARNYILTSTSATDSAGILNSSLTSIERITLDTRGTGDFNDSIDISGFVTAASIPVVIWVGNGDNTILGSNYADNIILGAGHNNVDAGGGNDIVQIHFENASGATFYVSGSGGTVVTTLDGVTTCIVSNAESITLSGNDTNAPVTTVDASALTGYSGQLFINDCNGSNISIGSSGSDVFANTYVFTLGTDVFTGNGGADVYDYTFAVGAMDRDTITDFDADDRIDFQFNNAVNNGGGLLANHFIGNSAFTGVAGEYRFATSGGHTIVQADTNGDGLADQTLTITNGTFVLVETAPGSNQLKLGGLVINGTSTANILTGTLGDDAIYALGGNDTINATQGADLIDGGAGTDRLAIVLADTTRFASYDGPRTYTLTSTSVTDSAGILNSSITSIERMTFNSQGTGDFDDTVNASGFTTTASIPLTITVGNGNNTIIGSSAGDNIFGGFGNNVIDAGGGNDTVRAAFDNRSGETLHLTNSGATLLTTVGGTVTNAITGAETVFVGGSHDGQFQYATDGLTSTVDGSGLGILSGVTLYYQDHDGDDVFIGSANAEIFTNTSGFTFGNDTYRGNGGADVYDYAFAIDALNHDVILDFDSDDLIDFQFNDGIVAGQLLCDKWLGSGAFTGVAGEYRYQIDGGQTLVQVDTNGDSVADHTLTLANGAFALKETSAGSNQLMLAAPIDGLDGVVADGYLAGATLFVDTNGNRQLDGGEAWTVTDANGNFALNVNQAGTLVAVGGTNLDTGLANSMTLTAPSGSGVVNPLTTLVQAVIDASGGATSAGQAVDQVLAALGLDPGLDLLNVDLLSHGTDPAALQAQKAAAMIANLVSEAEHAASADANTEAVLLSGLAGLVGGGGAVDLTNTATLAALLTEALPGATNVSALAQEISVEGKIISAATSLDGISDAQFDAASIDYSLDNIIIGDAGANHLYGLGGNDSLSGLAGNDILEGGSGFDFLWGGAGNDIFVAENSASKVQTKVGALSMDVVFDFSAGDKIDLRGIDANSAKAGEQAFNFKGSSANKVAADLSYKVYDSIAGAEKALGHDIDGVAGANHRSGPVTIVFGNVDGGSPDFAIALIGVNGVSASDFLFA
ncbi:MAG: hypothetical protein ABIO80_09475 [Sphingomicrobium sp.]